MARAVLEEDGRAPSPSSKNGTRAAGAVGVCRRPAAPDGAGVDDAFHPQTQCLRTLDRALADSGCEVLVDGPQILTDEISAIPDVIVTCAPIDLSTPVVAEPTIIVEVMSPPCEADDTLRKWFSYRQIPSLKHYLVLAQDRRLVQIHSRAGDLWRERFVSEGAIELHDPPLRMEIADLYAATELAA